MSLHYDEDLVEAVVFLCASGRRRGMPPLQIARFQRERERLYAILDPDERNAAFFKLHLGWFREWGLEQLLTERLAEFPLLAERLTLLALRKARSKVEEGAELYVNRGHRSENPVPRTELASADNGRSPGDATATTARNGIVAVLPERFASDEDLARFLRHELTHLQDMVAPAFGYSPELRLAGHTAAQERLTRELYRLLWDITIDGRLTHAGHATQAPREQHQANFDRAYAFWPEAQRREVFAELWTGREPRHARLLALASDPRDLQHAHRPLPGAPCPLCGFPTFAWADVPAVRQPILAAIQTEFPHWTVEQGACARCVEAYEASRKFAFPATIFT